MVTDLFLGVLIVIGIVIVDQLRTISRRLKSDSDQAEADDVLTHACPKLFFDPRHRPGLRLWYRARWPPNDVGDASWSDLHAVRYKKYASELVPNDASLELAASQGNKWARVQLLAHASGTIEMERRKELGLSRMEAQYLLYTFWRDEEEVPLRLREDEWKSEHVLAYVMTWLGSGLSAND